jgi:probable phosphomutase (TIGR03848 family)
MEAVEVSEEVTRVLLIRHGLNDFVTTKKLAGRTPGVHLNEKGQAQAQAVADRLAGMSLAAVYSSPLERTLETAEPIAAGHGLPVVPMDGLAETNCGDWTGQAIEELSKVDLWRQIQVQPSGVRFPGGESMAEIQARMVAALDALVAQHAGQTIVVVSHSDPIKLVLAHYIGLHMDMMQRLVITPASITELEFIQFHPRLLRCNDIAHLPPDKE